MLEKHCAVNKTRSVRQLDCRQFKGWALVPLHHNEDSEDRRQEVDSGEDQPLVVAHQLPEGVLREHFISQTKIFTCIF